MARIEITSGNDAGRVVELAAGTHLVGRHPSSALQLAVESVSGRHLELTVQADGTVHFKDLGSTNGTFSAGTKVSTGEWFAGSELKLGNITLKLLDPSVFGGAGSPAAADSEGDADADLHARARQAAMAGGRKGGPWMLIVLVLLVGGAGGTAWYFYPGEEEPVANGDPAAAAPGVQVAQSDLIQNLGLFGPDDAGAWALPEGVEISSDALRSSGGQKRVSLVQDFDVTSSGLAIQAEVSGGSAFAMIEWGSGDAEDGFTWFTGDLAKGAAQLPLPKEADWFRLAVLMQGKTQVSKLKVEAADVAAEESTHEDRQLITAGGNMILRYPGVGDLLRARSAGGKWSPAAGGLDFLADSDEHALSIEIGEAAVSEGPYLILSNGGPVSAASGVIVDHSPGLLIGGGARRFLVHFEQPAKVTARDGSASILGGGKIHLTWDLSEALNKSSRLARQLENAADAKQIDQILASSAELLRDWPLNDEKVALALRLVRETMQSGRQNLAQLEREKADAAFLRSISDLEALEKVARGMAKDYVGTELEADAVAEADDLLKNAAFLRQTQEVQAAIFRKRLSTALSNTYPLLADWLRREEIQ
ncbi:MAG: FHA domain-containing protein [Planctomycetes bacterium]|nr:FHA domain-containing protein [Planctomycetota bacterium]